MNAIQIARVTTVFGTPDTTVLDAAVRMTEQRSGAVLVRDEHNQLVGIFTERDNLQRVTAGGRDPRTTKLGEVMTKSVRTASTDTSVEGALDLMITNRVRHLPILYSSGAVAGLVSLQHAMLKHLRDEEASIETLADYVSAGGPG